MRWRMWGKIGLGLALLVLAIWLGRDVSDRLVALEHWETGQGAWAYVYFLAGLVLLTSLFIPDTLLAMAAGALFGVIAGTIVMVIGCLVTAALNYSIGRLLMHGTAQRVLRHSPRLAAIARAVHDEGFRFQVLLRLTPINPASVNYILGATNAHFPTFLAGCLGLVPWIIVEVYFGHVARHAALIAGRSGDRANLQTVLTVGGLLLCVALLVYIIRVARRALVEYEQSEAGPA